MPEFSTSEAQALAAIEEIKKRKNAIEEAAVRVKDTFNNLTETVQLEWLNNKITNDWNTNGNNSIESAKTALDNLINQLYKAVRESKKISEGKNES